MKRIFTVILSVLYLAVASGIGISIHYCMGNKTGVEYNYHAGNQCHHCGMASKPGCCHDDYKIIRISDDQQPARINVELPGLYTADIPVFDISCSQKEQGAELVSENGYHSPPDPRSSAIFRYNRVFRI